MNQHKPDYNSLYPSSQSLGSFGSLPIPELGAEEGEFTHDTEAVHGDDPETEHVRPKE